MKSIGGLLLLIAAPAAAQELVIPPATYPEIARSGANPRAFVPAGWAIERHATGDISADGRDDLAIVLKEADPKKIMVNEGFGARRVDTNPRILVVALAVQGGFRTVVSNRRLVPRFEIPTLSDPFGEDGGFEIKNGALKVRLFHFANMGGWDMGPTTFTFRYRGTALQLTGFDRMSIKRNSGETEELSINFLTARVKEAYGQAEKDEPNVTRWHRLKKKAVPTIDQIEDWQSFDPEGWTSRVFG